MSRQREKDFQGCLRCRVVKKKCDKKRKKCAFCMNNKYECYYPDDWPEIDFTILGKIGREAKEITALLPNYQCVCQVLVALLDSRSDLPDGVQPLALSSYAIPALIEEFFKVRRHDYAAN